MLAERAGSLAGVRAYFPTVCGILVPWPRIEPVSPAQKGRTTGPPGKSLDFFAGDGVGGCTVQLVGS